MLLSEDWAAQHAKHLVTGGSRVMPAMSALRSQGRKDSDMGSIGRSSGPRKILKGADHSRRHSKHGSHAPQNTGLPDIGGATSPPLKSPVGKGGKSNHKLGAV